GDSLATTYLQIERRVGVRNRALGSRRRRFGERRGHHLGEYGGDKRHYRKEQEGNEERPPVAARHPRYSRSCRQQARPHCEPPDSVGRPAGGLVRLLGGSADSDDTAGVSLETATSQPVWLGSWGILAVEPGAPS